MLQTGRSRVRFPMRCFSLNLPNPSGRTRPWGFTQPLSEMSTRNIKIMFKCGGCIGLTTLPPSVSRLSRQWGILNISQPYRPPRPVKGIALLYFRSAVYRFYNFLSQRRLHTFHCVCETIPVCGAFLLPHWDFLGFPEFLQTNPYSN
jgi:hypothetical protein